MRVFSLVTDGFGSVGGIAQYNRDLLTAVALCPAVREVVVLPRRGGDAAGLPAKAIQHGPVANAAAWSARALALAARRQFDLVFCGHLNAAPLGAFLAAVMGKPLWLQLHGIEAWADRGPSIRRALQRTSLVTAVSRYTRERFLAWSDLDPALVRVLPNTVGEFYTHGPKPPHLLARHGLEGKQVILTVGRLAARERYKGHDRVIAALPDVLRRFPRAVYLIAGTGDDRARLEGEARAAEVGAHVVFAGEIPADELPQYFRLADVFAMPSTGEGFGIVFLEAAASGLPVIAGDRDGSVDALAEGAIGILIDPHDRGALVEALVACLEQRSRRPPPGAIARFATANFCAHVNRLVSHFFAPGDEVTVTRTADTRRTPDRIASSPRELGSARP